jgi:diguanylate cyclase (GGDEF)-like protein
MHGEGTEVAEIPMSPIEGASAGYEAAMRGGRGPDAERIALTCLAEGVSVADLYERVVAPAMTRIGASWAVGEMTIADEHLASALNFKVMASVYSVSLAQRPCDSRGRVLLAGVEGDRHGVGLRMAGDVLELAGFDVLFLGEDMAAEDLVAAVLAHPPDLIALAIPTAAVVPAATATLEELRRAAPHTPVVLGGFGASGLACDDDSLRCSSSLGGLTAAVEELTSLGKSADPDADWPDPHEVPLRPRSFGEGASPEDRLLDIAAEAAEATRAHARIAQAYRRLAHEDPLTGAPNRRAFENRIQGLIEEGVAGSLILIDLDGFKAVNDRFGHAQGDTVLSRVAAVIGRETEHHGFAARLGGDEFAVVLPRTTVAAAEAHAAAILARLRAADVTATAGVAAVCRDRRESLMRADLALYRGKERGGDMVSSNSTP